MVSCIHNDLCQVYVLRQEWCSVLVRGGVEVRLVFPGPPDSRTSNTNLRWYVLKNSLHCQFGVFRYNMSVPRSRLQRPIDLVCRLFPLPTYRRRTPAPKWEPPPDTVRCLFSQRRRFRMYASNNTPKSQQTDLRWQTQHTHTHTSVHPYNTHLHIHTHTHTHTHTGAGTYICLLRPLGRGTERHL